MTDIDRQSTEFKEYLELYQQASLLELGSLADSVRQRHHPHELVTYIVDRNINYTNVCVADCKFCAFYRRPKDSEGYVLSFEEIGAKIDECKAIGGVQILLQGGHNPYIPFEWYLDLMRYIKEHHPIHIHGFSPSEIVFFSQRFAVPMPEVVRRLKAIANNSKAVSTAPAKSCRPFSLRPVPHRNGWSMPRARIGPCCRLFRWSAMKALPNLS